MEAIELPLPAGRTDPPGMVQVWGKRRLQGFADTGVFSISRGERQNAANPSVLECTTDDTTVSISRRLDIASHDRGNDPYNRYGASTRTRSW